jgi:cytochrome c553
MKNSRWIAGAVLLALPLVAMAAQQANRPSETTQAAKTVLADAHPLPWAYGADAPPPAPAPPNPPPPDTSLKHVPNSSQAFTMAQARDAFGPGDWHPEDHGAMPDIVAHGKRPDVIACSLCHYPNGKGRMENAPITGLPAAYFIQQMMDFKNGVRNSAEPRKANAKRMAGFAKVMSDDEIKAAAEYFAAIPYNTTWIKVVESKTAPKTRNAGGLFLKVEGNDTEPLGNRIVEVADNTEATETLRDDHSPFTAYAPVGSIKKGEALVTTGGAGKTVACGTCHGANLEGLGPVPPLAGRSPSYIARQLYDIQHGARNGLWSPLMQKAVAKLTSEDIVNICAYVASRPVGGTAQTASSK